MELSTPITIYWDLPHGSKYTEYHHRVCTDIQECRPLMIQLFFQDLYPEDNSSALLEMLSRASSSILLTVPAAQIANLPINRNELKELLISVESLNDLEKMRDTDLFSGISFSVNKNNWRQLPEVIRYCKNNRLLRVVLPMQRLNKAEKPFFITKQQQQKLSTSLLEAGGLTDLNLTIHDPFLWRAFYPERSFPQAGCQAANTMIFIAPEGNVYPCPTLPVSLGIIGELSLKEIIASPTKKGLRHKLITPPAACSECSSVRECRGGCRGRGLVLHASLDAIDTACL